MTDWLTRWQQTPEDEVLYDPEYGMSQPGRPPDERPYWTLEDLAAYSAAWADAEQAEEEPVQVPPGMSERDAWDYRCLHRVRHLLRTSAAAEQAEEDA